MPDPNDEMNKEEEALRRAREELRQIDEDLRKDEAETKSPAFHPDHARDGGLI